MTIELKIYEYLLSKIMIHKNGITWKLFNHTHPYISGCNRDIKMILSQKNQSFLVISFSTHVAVSLTNKSFLHVENYDTQKWHITWKLFYHTHPYIFGCNRDIKVILSLKIISIFPCHILPYTCGCISYQKKVLYMLKIIIHKNNTSRKLLYS